MDAVPDANVTYQFGDFELESASRTLRARETGAVVPLTSRAFDLLLLLVRRPNVPIGKRELIDALWPDSVVEDGNLDQAVFALRHALGERRGDYRYLSTIHRRGYQFIAPVTVLAKKRHDTRQQVAPPPAAIVRSPRSRHSSRVILLAGVLVLATAAGLFLRKTFVSQVAAPTPLPGDNGFAVTWFRSPVDDEEGNLLADAITKLLFQRFSGIRALPVISEESAWAARKLDDPAKVGQLLTARYLLKGSASRDKDRLHLEVELIDVPKAGTLWREVFDRPVADLTAVREEIAAQATAAMHCDPAVIHDAVKAPVSLEVYELYVRADRHMGGSETPAGIREATALFSRTTSLDPRFARGYLGIAQSLLWTADRTFNVMGIERTPTAGQASVALDRALELNPALGEAWVTRARLAALPADAERMFRRGMTLSPNYTIGAMWFSTFLADHNRVGEAIDVINRARVLDPRSAILLWLKAETVMRSRSNVDEYEGMLRDTLVLDPGFGPATSDLADSLMQWRGEFAEGIRLAESISGKNGARVSLANRYVEVDDPETALSTIRMSSAPPGFVSMTISLYRHDLGGCLEVARKVLGGSRFDLYDYAAQCVRDEATSRGDPASAVKLLEPIYLSRPWGESTVDHEFGVVFAHALILAGQVERGRELARQQLTSLNGDEIGRPAHWFSLERAQLNELLGDHERALDELAANQALNHWFGWWYTGDIDPIFSRLRRDPRFHALAEAARRHRATQRALLDDMRRRGEIVRLAAN